jgi:hypothetical protein
MIPLANSNDFWWAIAGSKPVSFKGVKHLPYAAAPE